MRIRSQLTPAVLLVVSAFFLSGCKSAEERAEEHYENALSLIAEGDVDRALVELRNVFDLDSNHVDARQTMAELQLERSNTRGAYRQYLHLAETNPDDLESRIKLTEIAFLSGEWDELDRHGARAEELAPDDPRVQAISLTRAYRAAISDDEDATRQNLGQKADTMLAEQPDSLLLRNVIMDNSIREQKYTRALAEIDWLIAYDPKSKRYYQERIRVLATLGDMSALEDLLREMVQVFPDDPTHKATLIRFYVSRDNIDAAEAVVRDLANNSAPDDPGPTIDLIRFLAEFGDLDAVQTELEKAISKSSDPVPFEILQASSDFSTGNRKEAIEALQDLLARSEPSERTNTVKITLAKMLLATGNEVGARKHVEEILTESTTHPEALKMQANWQILADDTDAAIGGLRTVLDQKPQDAEAMNLLSVAYARAGQTELAKDLLAQAAEASGHAPTESLRYANYLISEERYLPAEDVLLAALRIDSSNTDILVALGGLYLKMEDFGRVRSVVDTLRRLGGEDAIQAANGIEAERINRQVGVNEAMAYLEDLAGTADATLATKIALVRAKLGTGDSTEAFTLAQELKQENPDNDALDIVLAMVYVANNDLNSAEAIYRDLLTEDSSRPGVWRALSQLKMRQSDRAAAVSVVDEGLGHLPENGDLLWAKASFHEQDGDIDAAIAIYQTLYEKNSDSVVVANNLASLLSTYRDDETSLDRAWTIARRLRDTESPALMDTYGWLLHRRGNSDEALPYLQTAAQGLPQDPIVQYHLGQAFLALDRPQDAQVQFRMAVEIAGPTDTRPMIEDARALMQSLQDIETTGD